MVNDVMTPEEVAAYLRIKPQTLAVWRSRGGCNLPSFRVGNRVRYRLIDIQAWISQQRKDKI